VLVTAWTRCVVAPCVSSVCAVSISFFPQQNEEQEQHAGRCSAHQNHR
jgi:hypothetical protein